VIKIEIDELETEISELSEQFADLEALTSVQYMDKRQEKIPYYYGHEENGKLESVEMFQKRNKMVVNVQIGYIFKRIKKYYVVSLNDVEDKIGGMTSRNKRRFWIEEEEIESTNLQPLIQYLKDHPNTSPEVEIQYSKVYQSRHVTLFCYSEY
jgi:hypothetical protein